MSTSDSVYNKLKFNGYFVYLHFLDSGIEGFALRTSLDILDLTKDPMVFPSPAEAAMMIANGERHRRVCAPIYVTDNDYKILWIADDK